MKVVDKPWGNEVWIAQTDKYVGKIIFIKKGHRLSKQYHKIKHETIYVDAGELVFEINNETKILKAGEAIVVAPNTVHRMDARNSDVRIFEVSTPEVEDVVRLEDDYGRQEK